MWIIRDSDVCVFRGRKWRCGEWRTFFENSNFWGPQIRIFWNFKRSLEAEKVGDFVGWAFFLKGWLWLVGLVVVGQFVLCQFDLCGSLEGSRWSAFYWASTRISYQCPNS